VRIGGGGNKKKSIFFDMSDEKGQKRRIGIHPVSCSRFRFQLIEK
jgi:hypothetical protein